MSKWDGEYQVTIKYSKATSSNPKCAGWLFPDPFIVSGKKISGMLRHSSRGASFIKGFVAEDGSFAAKAAGSGGTADVLGQFTSAGASGTWKEKTNTFCAGDWTAVKK
jgi:hypothetical protein